METLKEIACCTTAAVGVIAMILIAAGMIAGERPPELPPAHSGDGRGFEPIRSTESIDGKDHTQADQRQAR